MPDVCLISPFPPPGVRHGGRSGVASYSRSLADALAAAGLQVLVVAPREEPGPRLERHGNLEVVRSAPRGPGCLHDAAGFAAASGAPVVHVQLETFLYGGPAALASLPAVLTSLRRRGAGVVVTAHQVVDPSEVDPDFVHMHRVRVPAAAARVALGGLQRALPLVSDRVVVHEPAFARSLSGATVVSHGVEAASPPDRDAARAELGLDGRTCVLCFGYLAPYKGLELALEAARLCADEVALVVAGGEHPRLAGRDDYAARLLRRYAGVARFTGYVPDAHVGLWFGAADAVLLPHPRPFSSSGALALALGFGRPALLSEPLAAACGLPELAVPASPQGLAARLRALARDPRGLARLEARCRELAVARSWPRVARKHVDIYEEVRGLARRPGGGRRAA